jgi:serine/threonine-protein kinase
MIDIKGYESFVKIEPIEKGWSEDKKYYIETADGQHLLLRISNRERYEDKKVAYDMMSYASTLDIPMSRPIEFGFCDGGKSVFMLLTWCDGKDIEELLPKLSETEQYVLGTKAGETLWKIHTLPAPENAEPWNEWFYRKVQGRIDFYYANPIQSEDGDLIIQYLKENKYLLDDRVQTFNHGDSSISNLIATPDGKVGLIDFNAFNRSYGDPWWEFDSIPWGTEPSAHFYTGLIKGYFNSEPPSEFFTMFAYYLAYDALAALCDTSVGNQGEPEEGKRHMENILRWLDNMKNLIPAWYLKDFYIQWTDGVPFKLKAPFDFSFLSKYGKVFKVFDEQASGNISFGIENGEHKYFIKFAGVRPEKYNEFNGDPTSAVVRLKEAVPVYVDLKHPSLIKFIKAEEIGNGYAALFEWEEAPGIEPLDSPEYVKFMTMPSEKKLRVFEDIMKFHLYVAERGYVALDFYDGSILYDYDNEKVIICDIDFYQKSPYIGDLGRICGSSRFSSPEERESGAVIDEITNVYTMGAIAFMLFTHSDRSPEAWPLNLALYDVVKKAVNDDRDKRQQSIEQLIAEWKAAKGIC